MGRNDLSGIPGFFSSVVVNEITPSYYASGDYQLEFELHGSGFLGIPVDAVGVPSSDNNDPLRSRNTMVETSVMTIVSRTDTTMLIRANGSVQHQNPLYLGALLSGDREIVYWVNDTAPLP